MRKISLYIAVFLLLCGFAFSANAQISTSTPLTEDERLVLISQIQAQLASLIQQLIEALNNQMNAAPVASGGFVEEETVYVPQSVPTETKNYEVTVHVYKILNNDTGVYENRIGVEALEYWPNDNINFRVTDDQTGEELVADSYEGTDQCVTEPQKGGGCATYAKYQLSTDRTKTYTVTMTVNGDTKETVIEWNNPADLNEKWPTGFYPFTWKSSRVIQ